MMEQTHTCEGHGNAILVAGHNDMIIAYGTTCLSNVLNTTLVGTLDIVAKGEESITAKAHLGVLGNPLFFLGQGKHLGLLSEELLPCAITQYVIVLILRDIHVDSVIAVGTTDAWLEGQVEHLGMLAQPPDVGLLTSQTGAVDTALLTSTDTDGLPVRDVADRA